MRSFYAYHLIRQSRQESSKETADVGQELLSLKRVFFHIIWRICQNRQYHLKTNITLPVLFFNMPVPVQRLSLAWENKNLVWGRTGGSSLLTGEFFHVGGKICSPGGENEQIFGWLLPPPSLPIVWKGVSASSFLFSSPLLDISPIFRKMQPPSLDTHHRKIPDSMIH